MTKNDKKMQLPKIEVDDLFTTQEDRDKVGVIKNIQLDMLEEFPEHPFKVKDDESLQKMKDSIIELGVLNPIIVRPTEKNCYQIVSGHRRKLACELSGITEIPAIVKDITDDEAIILMVDSNIQREKLLPSEKAFAYKMKLEALKHQGIRSDLTLSPMGTKLESKNSAQTIAEENGESKNNVYRYIRLTELIDELLDKVDEEIIAFRPAVEISYLSVDNQKALLDYIDLQLVTPSLSQAIQIKEMDKAGTLNADKIEDILSVEKPNQIERVKFNRERITNVLPKNVTEERMEDFVVKAIEFYSKALRKREEQSR